MKRLVLAVCALTLALRCSAAPLDGQWQGSLPTTGDINAVVEDRFQALDTGGVGTGFYEPGKGLHPYLSSVDRCGDTIWACGRKLLMRSDDGGFTWATKPVPENAPGEFTRIAVTSVDDLWMVGHIHPGGPGKNWLYHSPDGGKTWTEVLKGKVEGGLGLYCRGRERWLLQGQNGAWHSNDSGETWRKEDFGVSGFQPSNIAIPADTGTTGGFAIYVLGAVTSNPKSPARLLVKSDNGGMTWRKIELPQPDKLYFWRQPISFATSTHGWIGAADGSIIETRDGGATWTNRNLPEPRSIVALWFDTLGRGFAAVENGDLIHPSAAVYATPDCGEHWTVAATGSKQINAFAGTAPDRLIGVGTVPGYLPNDLVMILKPPSRR
ncbi:MAG TPA: YCF48-related protein [Capsulimonadaceae bacterium]|jgi:photosystem II stability/assembly factor-like uncharacterized protein